MCYVNLQYYKDIIEIAKVSKNLVLQLNIKSFVILTMLLETSVGYALRI